MDIYDTCTHRQNEWVHARYGFVGMWDLSSSMAYHTHVIECINVQCGDMHARIWNLLVYALLTGACMDGC